jgi:hypothetical protein
VEAARATGGEFAATWRNQEGAIVGSTWGGTMCWMPLKPWSLRISREDYTAIVPCGECPGCLEFYRRRLADRLKAKYGRPGTARDAENSTRHSIESATVAGTTGSLYLIRIFAPLERHAELSRKIHRRVGNKLEPGFLRLGATSFAVISRSKCLPPFHLGAVRLETRVEAIRLSRGRRAWRASTSGMLVGRDAYGAQVNRFYMPGLPPAESKSWDVHTKSGAKGYSRATSPRVWKSANLVLVPPEIWALGRADRRTLRRDLGLARSPEGVARVMAMVSEVLARRLQSSLIGPAVRPVLNIDQVREFYVRMAKRKADASVSEPTSQSSSPPSEGGSYVSSVHTAGADPPVPRADDGLYHGVRALVTRHIPQLPEDSLTDLTAKQLNKRRDRRLLDEHLERLHERIKGRT